MMGYMVSLAAIRKRHPCKSGWEKLLASKGKTSADDVMFPLSDVLESNGLDDALWCLVALDDEHAASIRLLACDFAERALVHVPAGENRPAEAIRVSRAFARGEATKDELAAAWAAAWDAAGAAARAAAWAAAGAAARAAAWAAAWDAAGAAAWDAAGAAERKEQERIFREWLGVL